MSKKFKSSSGIKEAVYFVKGMHCASCEILVEKKLLEIKGIKSVEASVGKGRVLVEYGGEKLSIEKLNKIFQKDNYRFLEAPEEPKKNVPKNELFLYLSIGLFLIVGFLSLNRLGLSGLVNISSKSSLIAFFAFGLLAGISSCAALVGGIVLSMSKQWLGLYSGRDSTYQKLQPHLLFNIGRMISYLVLGAALGLIGSRLQISFRFTSFLVIAISVMMLFLALQMLGIKAFRRFQFTLPKFATRYVADESNFKGRYMPFIMGALTFFLPCGFTITAQGLALLSGSMVQGALIMFFFALGTAPMLLLIGLSSVKFSNRPKLAYGFSKIAGILILFFAFFNINNQLNVLGYKSISDLISGRPVQAGQPNKADEKDLAPIIDGKQVIKMDASSYGYKPNSFKVRAGVPVRWEITDTGTSGCTNAIISRSLFDGQIDLTPGQVSVKEFTPEKPGKYKFSCWMGMISGTIEVVDQQKSLTSSGPPSNNNDATIPSGAKGCGCGGGSVGGCGAK